MVTWEVSNGDVTLAIIQYVLDHEKRSLSCGTFFDAFDDGDDDRKT